MKAIIKKIAEHMMIESEKSEKHRDVNFDDEKKINALKFELLEA